MVRDRTPNVVILECFVCWWEGGEEGNAGGYRGSKVARWEEWEVPGFIQGWGTQDLKEQKEPVIKGFEKTEIMEAVKPAQDIYLRCKNPFDDRRTK